MGKIKKEKHLQIVRTAVLKEKSKKNRQSTLDYDRSKIKEESAIRKKINRKSSKFSRTM